MRALLLIVRREVQERLRTNSFRLFTAGLFVLVLGAIVALDRAPEIFGEDSFVLGVPASAPPTLTSAIEDFASIEDAEVEITPYGTTDEAQRLLDDEEVDAFLSGGSLTYAGSEDTTLTAIVSNAVYAHGLIERLEGLGLNEQEQEDLLRAEPVEVVLQDEDAAGAGERQLIGFIAVLSLYLTLAIYGNWILTGIVEEKASRVVEVLLGLVRPHELLAGKTLGILLMAVGQLLVALLGAAAGLIIVGTDSLPAVALDVVLVAGPLFVLGLLLYSLIYAATGATVSRQADAQAASTPIGMMLLVPYMFSAIFVPGSPDGPAATALSLFPLTSPLVMPARVASGDPTVIELVACFALLVPAIAFVAFVGGRIYAAAILSGRKFKLANLVGLVLRPREVG
jgi:ABC-2 type transport system permease protein